MTTSSEKEELQEHFIYVEGVLSDLNKAFLNAAGVKGWEEKPLKKIQDALHNLKQAVGGDGSRLYELIEELSSRLDEHDELQESHDKLKAENLDLKRKALQTRFGFICGIIILSANVALGLVNLGVKLGLK